MCKSTLKNGLCAKYGIFCAKAHKSSEVRNLVKIFGENWKLHYDVSARQQSSRCLKSTSTRKSAKRWYNKQNVRGFLPKKPMSIELHDVEPKLDDLLIVAGSPLFAPSESPMVESSEECSDFAFPLYENLEYSLSSGDKQLGDYTDLYSENAVAGQSLSSDFPPFVPSPFSVSEEPRTTSSQTTLTEYSTFIDYRERLFTCSTALTRGLLDI